jgi:hypothetical protein
MERKVPAATADLVVAVVVITHHSLAARVIHHLHHRHKAAAVGQTLALAPTKLVPVVAAQEQLAALQQAGRQVLVGQDHLAAFAPEVASPMQVVAAAA